MLALVGFTILLHMLLPFSHRLLHDAKGYAIFLIHEIRWSWGERRARARQTTSRRDVPLNVGPTVHD